MGAEILNENDSHLHLGWANANENHSHLEVKKIWLQNPNQFFLLKNLVVLERKNFKQKKWGSSN